MKPVQRLRKAAELITQTSAEATVSPWKYLPGANPPGSLVFSPQQTVCATSTRNARHIATWSPEVALDVAQILLDEADRCEGSELPQEIYAELTSSPALRIADAVIAVHGLDL